MVVVVVVVVVVVARNHMQRTLLHRLKNLTHLYIILPGIINTLTLQQFHQTSGMHLQKLTLKNSFEMVITLHHEFSGSILLLQGVQTLFISNLHI